MKKKVIKFSLLISLSILSAIAHAEKIYTIARAPQLSVSKTEKDWTPYIQYLNENTDYKFQLKLYNDRNKFENDIKTGTVDFYYGNPGYGVVGYLKQGYRPLLKSNAKMLQGIVVVKKSSPIVNINQLKDKQLVFPGKTAFAASLLIKYYIHKQYNIVVEEEYVSGHDNVYKNILNGNYIAGGGVHKTLDREPEALKNKLRIIYETPKVASHPFMVHPLVSVAVSDALLKNTIYLNNNENGIKILKQIKLTKPVKADYKTDYMPLEPLIKNIYSYLLVD